MDKQVRQLIFQAIDQTITADGMEKLQDAIEHDDEVRDEYLRAVRLCDTIGTLTEYDFETPESIGRDFVQRDSQQRSSPWDLRSPGWIAIAASTLFVATSLAFWLGRGKQPTGQQASVAVNAPEEEPEALIAGHATLRRSVDLVWPDGVSNYREGDVIADGPLKIEQGIAEIDFFCGATIVVEGPALLDIESDWAVRVHQGSLRANVPPAAQGFTVKATDAEIIDLGTEFALSIDSGKARVQVIDGEVKLKGGKHDGDHLVTGQSRWLQGDTSQLPAFDGMTTDGDVDRRLIEAEAERLARWRRHSETLAKDSRLIAYFPIAMDGEGRTVSNTSSKGASFDGKIIGPVDRTSGRFGQQSAGLEFERPGARVRTRIDGEFEALTFACWVRIDRTDHVYNSLFMSDGYENGEVHWQIRNDGRMMFSVMIDDSQDVQVRSKYDNQIVRDAGLHRVYFTEPIWDISKSGQWFHLAAVYSPEDRRVEQFVNGKMVSSEPIVDEFYIEKLRIGAAEIGNWGQPFRKSPWFAIRNLNGAIDEMAIFNAALDAQEIQSLYEKGKPIGY